MNDKKQLAENRIKMTKEEILQTIEKSGYLFESEVAKFLIDNDHFVQSNVVFQDPITNKSREIDIVSETFRSKDLFACKVNYYFELKNLGFPVVLMTPLYPGPNTPDEIYKEIVCIPEGVKYDGNGVFSDHLSDLEKPIYTQYCSFELKKGNKKDIVASQPEGLYSGLAKICNYCEQETLNDVESSERMNGQQYFRHWLNLPVLLLRNELYELSIDEQNNTTIIEKVGAARLLVNFHFEDRPTSTVVYVVTWNYFPEWLAEMNVLEDAVRDGMRKAKAK